MNRLIAIFCMIVFLTVILLGGRMLWLSKKSSSQKPQNIGLVDGHLKSCSSKPNCVSSQAIPDSSHYIKPLTSEDIKTLWMDLPNKLAGMGYQLEKQSENYLHFTVTTQLLSFVDDVEFALNSSQNHIEVRSQSRVGYSDMGTNRRRIEELRKQLQKQ